MEQLNLENAVQRGKGLQDSDSQGKPTDCHITNSVRGDRSVLPCGSEDCGDLPRSTAFSRLKRKCHFIGIGGIGMSGLAKMLLQRNIEVTGSDLVQSAITEKLEKAGAKISFEHSSQSVTPNMTVIFSSDIPQDNPEFEAAVNLKCKMLHRSDLLVELMDGYKTLAVAGTHGKTSTSALLAWVLKDSSFAVGGVIPQLDGNAGHGEGEYFVAEADESDGTFLKYKPYGAIVTNIGLDHMNHYKTEEELLIAFQTFFNQTENLFWCKDDPRLNQMNPKGTSYGFSEGCDVRAFNYQQEGWKSFFDVEIGENRYHAIELSLPGRHYVLNALGIFAIAHSIGVEVEVIRSAFQSFRGVLRRCEKKGESSGVLFLDDYAHHPTEIKATLKAIREAVQGRRLVAIFQPHRYTRTRDCMHLLGDAFVDADALILTDIFASREQPILGVTIENVGKNITTPYSYFPPRDLVPSVAKMLRPNDVVVTLGAGDITRVGGELMETLETRGIKKYRVGVLFGGRSSEHDVSVMSSQFVFDFLNRDYYEAVPFFIPHEGQWLTSEVLEKLQSCDLFFPILHGNFGEDGTLQGFLELLDKPYVGPDYRSCAISMDKVVSKSIWKAHGVRTSPFVDFTPYQWDNEREAILEKINGLGYPLYAKGPHLGSSVATYRIANKEELEEAIAKILKYDTHILVEKELRGREIEFPVFGNDQITVLHPGEVFSDGNLYDYRSKYSNDGITSVKQADLTEEQLEAGREIVKKAYRLAGCTVFARVDTYLDEEGQFWIGEINPLPGLTEFSLFPKMCEANGMDGEQLVDRVLTLALARKRDRAHL